MISARQPELRLSEHDFQQHVVEYALLRGWRVYAVLDQRHYARRTSKGWPDLVLVKGKRMLLIELKGEGGRVTLEQQAWLQALKQVEDVKACAAWPQNWEEIQRELDA